MMKRADLTGKTFGRLTVVQLGKVDTHHRTYWFCRCSCGQVKEIRGDGLIAGSVISCGHIGRERRAAATSKPMPTGSRYWRLVIVRRLSSIPKRGHVYECRCDCGRLIEVQGRHLRSGEASSCGCWYRDTRGLQKFRHGHARIKNTSPEYRAYCHAKSVCHNERDRGYYCCGGRGIKFLFKRFEEFLAEVGLRPGPDYRLRRGDRDGNFEVGNLAWVPIKRPCRRKRRSRR